MKWWLFDIVVDACIAALQSQEKKALPSDSGKAQIIFALERAEQSLQAQADVLLDQHDYNAEFPAADAERMREAIVLIRTLR